MSKKEHLVDNIAEFIDSRDAHVDKAGNAKSIPGEVGKAWVQNMIQQVQLGLQQHGLCGAHHAQCAMVYLQSHPLRHFKVCIGCAV